MVYKPELMVGYVIQYFANIDILKGIFNGFSRICLNGR